MFTPQEVSEHTFPKASFGGYNMNSVDEFLDQLTLDYTALYKENASLKAKMKVLADSLEEYRATEKGMRRALLAAQQAAEEMVKEAEAHKSVLLRDAETEAAAQIEELKQQVADEKARLVAAQTATAEFVTQVRDACRKQEEFLNDLPSVCAAPCSDFSVEQAALDIEESVQRAISAEEEASEEQIDHADEEPESADLTDPEKDDEPVSLYEELTTTRSHRDQERERSFDLVEEKMDTENSPTRRIDFDTLQFGSNYDLK